MSKTSKVKKKKKARARAAICSFCQVVACVGVCCNCMCSVIGGGLAYSSVWCDRGSLCNWGLGVSMHSVISQIRVIHLLCVSVRAQASPLITASHPFPSIILYTLFSYSLIPSLCFPPSCTVQMLCFILITGSPTSRQADTITHTCAVHGEKLANMHACVHGGA